MLFRKCFSNVYLLSSIDYAIIILGLKYQHHLMSKVSCFYNNCIYRDDNRQEKANMVNEPKHPYSDAVQRLIGDKSGTLLQACLCLSLGLRKEAEKFFDFAANKEEQIANLLEASGNFEDAVINRISAASCYSMAGKYHQAKDLFQFILHRYKKYMTDKRLSEVIQLKEECDEAVKNQKKIP